MNEKLEFLAKGKRSLVYKVPEKDEVVKIKHPDSKANCRLEIEAGFLKLLNKHGIGPRFISFKGGNLRMEFIDGLRIDKFLQIANKKNCEKVLKIVLKQVRKLDELGINKFEMTRPIKHIIVKEDLTPVMIDFERCKYTHRPKNLNQFKEFLRKTGYSRLVN